MKMANKLIDCIQYIVRNFKSQEEKIHRKKKMTCFLPLRVIQLSISQGQLHSNCPTETLLFKEIQLFVVLASIPQKKAKKVLNTTISSTVNKIKCQFGFNNQTSKIFVH